jgi:hypothetical protein
MNYPTQLLVINFNNKKLSELEQTLNYASGGIANRSLC